MMKRRGLVGAFAALLIAFGLSASAHAMDPDVPGQVLWTYYETTEAFTDCFSSGADLDGCDVGGAGDNIIRLINPNGAANSNLAGAQTNTVCAMIYVFDDDEEMGECCGCPISSAGLATFSVEQNLTSNWGLSGGSEQGDHGNGSIAIIAASPNTTPLTPGGGHEAANCLGGACCDPTNVPGYPVAVAGGNNLLGSITHNQEIDPVDGQLTETKLFDDCHGEDINLVYLQNQCGAIVGNGTHGAICNCPIE
jgi:hypothetical protein